MTELHRCSCGNIGQRAGSHGGEELETDMFALDENETEFVCLRCIREAVAEAVGEPEVARHAPEER